jgi:protein phosphatase
LSSITSAAKTHTGRRRQGNEDASLVRADLGLYLVADGMGGHAAGDIASRLAAETIGSVIQDTSDADLTSTWPMPFDPAISIDGNRYRAAFLLANRRLTAAMDENEQLRGMATTAASLLVRGDRATIAHVGDSRVYRLRGGRIELMTSDHSWVNEQIQSGRLSEDDARRHPWRNVVTRAITGSDEPAPELQEVTLRAGDRFLICSDGLTTVVSDPEIERLLADGDDLERITETLIDAANDAGGPDNITVVIVQVDNVG